MTQSSLGRSARALVTKRLRNSEFFQATALPFRKAPPDPKTFILLEGIFQAIHADLTGEAYFLSLAGTTAFFREKCLRVGLRAQGLFLPRKLLRVLSASDPSAAPRCA